MIIVRFIGANIILKNMVLWIVMLCSSNRASYFRGSYHLHIQGQPAGGFLLGLVFDSENGGIVRL
jgi:hypothetical protein